MFDKKGVIVIERTSDIDEDELMMAVLDAGAEDFVPQDDCFEVYTAPNDYFSVRDSIESMKLNILSGEVAMLPQTTVDITDEEMVAKVQRLLDMFDDDDDVQNVYHNANLPEEEEED